MRLLLRAKRAKVTEKYATKKTIIFGHFSDLLKSHTLDVLII